ncbi:uncharacterized protein M421DRAFT_77537, partial [Didymella exigua CBS 183.55]
LPAHLLHLTQPLNIGYFATLKCAYKKEIRALVNSYINYINKKAFLDTYSKVYKGVFLSNNIRSSFRAASLVLDNLGVVLLKLNIKLCTPTPPLLTTTSWQLRTLSNTLKIGV